MKLILLNVTDIDGMYVEVIRVVYRTCWCQTCEFDGYL